MHLDPWSTLHYVNTGKKTVIMVPLLVKTGSPKEYTTSSQQITTCPVLHKTWALLSRLQRLQPQDKLNHTKVWHLVKHCPGATRTTLTPGKLVYSWI